jgi:putative plasmid transfer factor (traG)
MMIDEEINREAQKKAFIYTAFIFVILTLITQWYITQAVAEECNYHPLLGSYLSLGDSKIYPPYDYFLWSYDEHLSKAIPDILDAYSSVTQLVLLLSMVCMVFLKKAFLKQTSHGSASFASKKDIEKSDLGSYASKNGGVYEYKKTKKKLLGLIPYTKKEKIIKDSGVVVGINPYTHKLMLHDGVEHMLLMAPTRSGKGVCTIIPTGLIWKHSIFFFDPKGELWSLTSGYRKNVLKQKVLKFQPLCTDGSAARWNPLAEVNYRTTEELSDVQSIVSVMVRPDGESKGDDFWPNSAAALLNGVILHLLYKHDREERPLPCPTDIMSFLSSPDKSTEELFTDMRDYPHISPDEFMEVEEIGEDGKPVLDENGVVKRKRNPLKEIYGEYIKDFRPFVQALGIKVKSIDEIRVALRQKIKQGEKIQWETMDSSGLPTNAPYHLLLSHPKVAECAANILNGAQQTTASIMQTAQTSLAIYQDPVVQNNTSVSDFAIRDLLDPQQEVSLYLCMEVKDIAAVKPIARLFIQMICSKLIRDMKFETDPNKPAPKKQRLLLMLDEFPQLGNMKCIELALAICAGYGIKVCIVCQDVNQLNKEYTKDNSIGSNCHVHIYFTPNIDSGGATAEAISKTLGKRTISTISHSDGGGGFFKGSNSTSQTGRELMTPDEVSQMSSEKELIFVAGHKPIFGDKLRYYEYQFLIKRTQIKSPAMSDTVTRVTNFKELFHVHEADRSAKEDDRKRVIEDQAKRAGLSYRDYVQKLEAEKMEYEREVIRRITGEDPVEEELNEQEAADTRTETAGEEKPVSQSENINGETAADHRTWAESPKKVDMERGMYRGTVEDARQSAIQQEMELKEKRRMNILQATEDTVESSPTDIVSQLIDTDVSLLAIMDTEKEDEQPKEITAETLLSNFIFGEDDLDEAAPDDLDMDDDLFGEDTAAGGDSPNSDSPISGLDAFLGTLNKERRE